MINWLVTKSNRKSELNIRVHRDITGEMWFGVGLVELTTNKNGRAISDPALYCSM